MSKESSAAISIAQPGSPDRAVGSEELIRRMAEDLKTKSGSDLPLSCFVQQVKMQLAGRSPSISLTAKASLAANKPTTNHHSSDLYRAWAMPD